MEASSSNSTVSYNLSKDEDLTKNKNQWSKPTTSLRGSGFEYLKYIDKRISERKSMRIENPINEILDKLPLKRTVTL